MCRSRLPPRCGTAPLLTPLRLGLSHLTRTAGCYSPAGYFHIPFLSFLNCDVSHVLSTLRTPRLAGRRRPFTDPFGRVHPPGFRPHSPAFHSRKLSAILSSTEPHPHLQTPPTQGLRADPSGLSCPWSLSNAAHRLPLCAAPRGFLLPPRTPFLLRHLP